MKYDIKTIDHWDAPKEDGAPILCMPNIPLPLFNLAPRTIKPNKWEITRKRCYMMANYTCQACGVELGHGHLHAHELYSIDWANQIARFERPVALDPCLHVRFIHSGRALTLYKKHDPQMPRSAMLSTLEQGFDLIHKWNLEHPDSETLRVCSTILDWASHPDLEATVNKLIQDYDIKFYDFNKNCFSKQNWGKWKLIWEDKEYPTKYPTKDDWEKVFNSPDTKDKSSMIELPDDIAKELEEILSQE